MSARNTFAATRRSHQILKWLKNGEGVTIQRVIDNFGIKYPQAREDLKLLEELYDLHTFRDGRIKVWAWNGFDPEHVTVATAAALEFGGVALDLFRDTPYYDEIQRLAEHCRDRVGEAQQARLGRVSQALHLRRTWLPIHESRVNDNVESILDAVFLDRALALKYERSDGEVGHYVVSPRQLVWYNGRLWLLGEHEDTSKLFDVAGIKNLDSLDGENGAAIGEPMNSDEIETLFADAFGIYTHNYPAESVHLEVRGPWSNYLRRYRLHPSQENEADGESLHVHFDVGLCPEFRSFVLGMIPDVRVHAPTNFRDDITTAVSSWLPADA
jgi:predicted DNA-binding transcriptional regulator YafY